MQTSKHIIPDRFLPKIPKAGIEAKNNTNMAQKNKIMSKDELSKMSKKVVKPNSVLSPHANKLTTRTYN